jgi:hypothetical protein
MSWKRKSNKYVGNINCNAVTIIWKIFNFDLIQTFISLMLQCILQVRLADPDIVSDPSEYQKLAQSVSELDQVFGLLTMVFNVGVYYLLNYTRIWAANFIKCCITFFFLSIIFRSWPHTGNSRIVRGNLKRQKVGMPRDFWCLWENTRLLTFFYFAI